MSAVQVYLAVAILIACAVAYIDGRENRVRPDHLVTGGKAVVVAVCWPFVLVVGAVVGVLWCIGKLGHWVAGYAE